MGVVGRGREIDAVDLLLDRAAAGSGGVLVVAGPAGSGRTALADVSAQRARSRGFAVLRVAAAERQAGRWVWAQLLRDVAAPEELIARLLAAPTSQDFDVAAQLLCAGPARLLVVDDVERGGSEALEMLAVLSGRAVSGRTAVLATSCTRLGVGDEFWLAPLGPDELAAVIDEHRPDVRHAVWAASGGLPGPALALAQTLAALPADTDPVVEVALRAESAERFLAVDTGLVLLLETALSRADEDGTRARLLARLAYTLLGDAFAAERRRALVQEALLLARRSGSPAVLAEVLDAQLHALWDAAGAVDRLRTADEIVALARVTGDLARERRALFWRFVALMELGRVAEAEAALAAFERQTRLAGDAADEVMAASRHAMLATLRGRFDDAQRLIEQVADRGEQIQLADTEALLGTMRGAITALRGDGAAGDAQVEALRAASRAHPGHFYEATTARILVMTGRAVEAALELERMLPLVLAGSGPRWLGAVADLAVVAVATGNTAAAEHLDAVLWPYRGQLVIWAGANTCTGPVGYYLGLLAAELGRPDDAAQLLSEAIALEEQIGALPWLALTVAALAEVLSNRAATDDVAAKMVSQHRRRARDIAQQLGMNGLLRSLAPPAEEWTLRREGDDWMLLAGQELARLPDSRGLRYLRALLAVPGREISSLDLAAGGAGLHDARPEQTLDAAARDAYRRRLSALDAQLDLADSTGDAELAQHVENERQALVAELRRSSGLGGRPRRLAAEDERARVNVTRTLRSAVDRIASVAPSAGAHLASSIRTGRACRYEPAPGGPTRWHV